MLEHDRINISEGIDINKTNALKECNICHYWYLLDKSFKFGPYLCNGCYALIKKALSFNDVAIVSIILSKYRIRFWYINKDDTKTTMNNFDLEKVVHHNLFSSYIKMSETTYYQRNRDVMVHRAKGYYESNKEVLR